MTTTKTSPLSLTADMAAAWHRGWKTELRRPIKPQPPVDDLYFRTRADGSVCVWAALNSGETYQASPRYQPGDIVWIREPGRVVKSLPPQFVLSVKYLADSDIRCTVWPVRFKDADWAWGCQGIPNGIFKEACRSWGKVLTVRAERVQDITWQGACAEGFDNTTEKYRHDPIGWFRHLWDSLYASRGLGWDANPWVWAYKLEKCDIGRRGGSK